MPWTADTLADVLLANPALAERNPGEAGRLVPRFAAEPVRSAPATVPLPDREAFRSLVLALLPDRLPGVGGLKPEERLQAEIVALCHRRVRRDGWAVLPFMVPNGVLIPRRGGTPEERARDPLPAIIGARLKAMGLIPGIGDLGFLMWTAGGPGLAFMECKRPRDGQAGFALVRGSLRVRAPRKGVTSGNQATFARLCRLAGWPCPTVETLAHAEAELLDWGVAG